MTSISAALDADAYWFELELRVRLEREVDYPPGATVYGRHGATRWWHVHVFTMRRPDGTWALLECRCGQRIARVRGFGGYQPVDRAWLNREAPAVPLPPLGGSSLPRPLSTSVPGPGSTVSK